MIITGARRFGSRIDPLGAFPEGVPCVAASEDGMASAYFEMSNGRRSGEPFAGAMLLDDPRALFAQQVAHQFTAGRSYAEARGLFEALAAGSLEVNGKPVLENAAYPQPTMVLTRDLCRLCDLLLVRSYTEYARYEQLFEIEPPAFERWIFPRELGTWQYRGQRKNRIVVWGPTRPAEESALFIAGLHTLHAEIVVVHGGGTPTSDRAVYLDFERADWQRVMEDAMCVVDTSICDPSWSRAFAERGVPVAFSRTSAAHEWIQNGASYVPWSARSVAAAVAAASANGPAWPRGSMPREAAIAAALDATRPVPALSAPLVSVIIPTYNRPEILEQNALRSLIAQTYQNIEIVIVNDGGTKVGHLEALDSRIRVFDRDVNVGANEAENFGMIHATGKYALFFGDDDGLFPDHLARLVAAAERTGMGVAHANTLIRYETPRPDGSWGTHGFNASVFASSVDGYEVLVSSPISGQGLLVRLDIARAIGPIVDFALGDQEQQIRIAKQTDFVHVRHYTSEWLVRDGPFNLSSRNATVFPEALRRMFDLHPVPGDERLEHIRKATIENVARRPPGYTFPPIVHTSSQ